MPSLPAGNPAEQQPSAVEPGSPLQKLLQVRHSRWARLILTVLAVLFIAASGYYVVSKLLASLRALSQAGFVLHLWPVFLSLLVILICVLLGGIIWHLILSSMGRQPPLRGSCRAHLLANLAGYLPGYGWKYLGKGYLTSRQGVPFASATLAVLIEFSALAFTRAAITFTFMETVMWQQYTNNTAVMWLWLLRFLTWLAVFALPVALKMIVRRRPGLLFRDIVEVRVGDIWLAELLMCAAWVLVGVGYVILLESVTTSSFMYLRETIFSTTASYLISLLAFFVPGGFGVRESVIIVTLAGVLPEEAVTLTAVLSRAVLIVAELLGALTGLSISSKASSAETGKGDASCRSEPKE